MQNIWVGRSTTPPGAVARLWTTCHRLHTLQLFEQALCVIEVNKCSYLYCLVAAKICTVCLELYRACRFFFRHCRRCFVASIRDQIFTRVDSTRAYYVMWSPNPARRCIRKVSTYLFWKLNCIYLSIFFFSQYFKISDGINITCLPAYV